MGAFLQILIALLVAWLAWRLIRKMLRPQAPAEPIEDPSRRLAQRENMDPSWGARTITIRLIAFRRV